MLMGARPNSCRQTHLNHKDPHPASHGSHLTANKVPNSRERSRFRGIEESHRTTEVRQEDGKKTKQEGKCLSLPAFYCVTRDRHTVGIILCSPPNEGAVPTRALFWYNSSQTCTCFRQQSLALQEHTVT
ncbi:hypothetical protein ElyMa_005966000 [Elysia marginata]|uniref:Ig-like domain-containing protein n=1 Tax=Elysia marginata TaxID=1093978 RepID=A0AAV4GDB2_9GAST|nr:hypothetical protein ElyMa_005966000 [Elysia marginata]